MFFLPPFCAHPGPSFETGWDPVLEEAPVWRHRGDEGLSSRGLTVWGTEDEGTLG